MYTPSHCTIFIIANIVYSSIMTSITIHEKVLTKRYLEDDFLDDYDNKNLPSEEGVGGNEVNSDSDSDVPDAQTKRPKTDYLPNRLEHFKQQKPEAQQQLAKEVQQQQKQQQQQSQSQQAATQPLKVIDENERLVEDVKIVRNPDEYHNKRSYYVYEQEDYDLWSHQPLKAKVVKTLPSFIFRLAFEDKWENYIIPHYATCSLDNKALYSLATTHHILAYSFSVLMHKQNHRFVVFFRVISLTNQFESYVQRQMYQRVQQVDQILGEVSKLHTVIPNKIRIILPSRFKLDNIQSGAQLINQVCLMANAKFESKTTTNSNIPVHLQNMSKCITIDNRHTSCYMHWYSVQNNTILLNTQRDNDSDVGTVRKNKRNCSKCLACKQCIKLRRPCHQHIICKHQIKAFV